jgi:hypothetical protein
VITGYGVISTEIDEKIAECSDCGGKGFILQRADIKGDQTLLLLRIDQK